MPCTHVNRRFPTHPLPLSLLATPSRLQIELENTKAEAATWRQRSKAELEEARRVIQEITVERDSLLSKLQLLNNVNGN